MKNFTESKKKAEYVWVQKVIQSCENGEQLENVRKLITLFNRKYLDFRLELMLGSSLKKMYKINNKLVK